MNEERYDYEQQYDDERAQWELECAVRARRKHVDEHPDRFVNVRVNDQGAYEVIDHTKPALVSVEGFPAPAPELLERFKNWKPLPFRTTTKYVEWTEDVRHVDDEMIRRTPSDLVVIPSHRKVKYRCPEWQVLAYDRMGRPISFRVPPTIEEVK